MKPVKTVKDIDIYEDENDQTSIEVIEDWINDLDVFEDLKGGAIVVAETTLGDNYLQHCYGVDIAIDLLKKDPERFVLCLSSLPIEMVRHLNSNVDILGFYPNATFLCFAFMEDSFLEELKRAIDKKEEIFSKENKAKAVWSYASGTISKAVHDLKVDDPKNPKNDYEQNTVRRVVEDVKDVFPSLENASDDEVIDFIYEANSNREEVMEGEEIQGVYCDIEDTLLVEGELNSKVIGILETYKKRGKEIILWTDGDIEELGFKLKELGIEYPVRSKADFSGATAEVVIDDMDNFYFSAETKISAKTFIQI